MSTSQIPPGWYLDPDGKPCERFWDGNLWSENTRPLSTMNGKPAPKTPKVGIDSNEKLLLIILAFAFLSVFLFYPF